MTLAEFPAPLVQELEPMAGFRNVLIHEYVELDLERAVKALENLGRVEDFAAIVGRLARDRDP